MQQDHVVTRPKSVKSRPIPFFQDQDHFFKVYQIINPRPQKTALTEKMLAGYAGFSQSCRYYAGNRKNTCLLTVSSQVLFRSKLRSEIWLYPKSGS